MSNRDSEFGAFISGFVIGGLVGAAVALLLAPQSGEETRTIIRDKSIELKDLATEQADVARSRAAEVTSQARARTEEAVSKARSQVEDIAQTTKGRVSELQDRGRVVLDEQKERLSEAIEAGKRAAQRSGTEIEGGGEDSKEDATA